MGFRRSPKGFKLEKSALGASCEISADAFAAGKSAREEAAAALCKKHRRVVPKSVGIYVFSSVEKTFNWRRHSLSSGMKKNQVKESSRGEVRREFGEHYSMRTA
jgi:hypothetical protein